MPTSPRKVKAQLVPTEAQDQIKLMVWLKKNYPDLRVSASANGGSRNYHEAIKFKRMGVSPGFPDVEIPFPAYPYHGLYIELKREKGGKVSDLQKDWIDYLNSVGYYACVAHGFDEASCIVSKYLRNEIFDEK